jgi:hypothetical protein
MQGNNFNNLNIFNIPDNGLNKPQDFKNEKEKKWLDIKKR